MSTGKFAYFAFASNLLKERLTKNNPSAVFLTVAKLQGYQLVFCEEYPRWHGGGANIVPKADSAVWGVVWTMDIADQASLDRQESGYTRIEVEVTTADGAFLKCSTYKLQGNYKVNRPSRHYKDIIIRGARQSGLPQEFISQLEKIQCNEFEGEIPLYNEIVNSIRK